MIEIKFNYFIRKVLGGEKCETISFTDLKPGPTDEKISITPCIQTYDCGFRRDGSHGDYTMWNGTIFIDIDSKKFYKEFNYQLFRKGLINSLETSWDKNYCFNQTSMSGNSCHIVLYFKCERNETNFKKCCILAKNIILDAGKKCGRQFEEILNYPGVLDDCTTHIGQPLFLSTHKIHLSNYLEEITGECDLDNIELAENEYTEQEISFNSKAKYKVKNILDELPDYQYHTRWGLLWIILNYFNWDYDKCKEVWCKILPLILKNRTDYSEHKLLEQFERDFRTNKGKQYAFKSSLLEWSKKNLGFKYEVKRKFEPKAIDLYNADIEYTLKENEYLSSIDIPFSDGFNHIFAGCGVGKTRFAIETGKKKRVCFISPMTSINKNSFDRIDEHWLIIDELHKDEAIHICGSIKKALNSKWSICTTWESFALHEMWRYHFDYVMVDESHTMYMYDYRVKSIQALKAALKKIKDTPVIFMSGTPSFEICEFDCYKIKINKEITHVPCNLLFFNQQYKGFIYDDIKKWTAQDPNNMAIIFYDKTNYHTKDDLEYYGLDISIFSKSFKETTEYVLENETFPDQITAVSVYGQAGINIYIEPDKKARLYILNTNALCVIQYANRIRNKEVIDKVIIPYRIDNIDNRIIPADEKANFEEAYSKVKMINDTKKVNNMDVFQLLSKKQYISLKFGLVTDVLDVIDDEVILKENIYETWNIITHICQYESQIQLIYNHLVSNQFDVNYVYLDEDIKTSKSTKMRVNQFAGQMVRFDFDKMVKLYEKENRLYLDMTNEFQKYAVGDTKERIEHILNYFWTENNDLEYVKNSFNDIVKRIVKKNGTIKKIDLTRYDDYLHIRKHFREYVDNAFLISMLDPEMDVKKATAAYVRYIYTDKIDWKLAAEETYIEMGKIKNIVSEYRESFEELKPDVYKLNIPNDNKMKEIYTYICGKHGGNKNNGVTIEGIWYPSQRDAAAKLGKSIGWISKHKDKI